MARSSTNILITSFQILGDVFFLNMAIVLAFLLRFRGDLPQQNFEPYLSVLPIISIVALFLFHFYGLYHTKKKEWAEIAASVIVAVLILTVVTIALSYMLQTYAFPRSVFLIAALLQVFILSTWRWLMLRWEAKFISPWRAIVVGPYVEAKSLAEKIVHDGHKVLGLITNVEKEKDECEAKTIGTYKDILKVCDSYQPDAVYISGPVPEKIKEAVTRGALENRWQVFLVPEFYEILVAQAKLEQLGDKPVFEIGPWQNSQGREQAKRAMDVALALIGLVVTAPVILLCALAIKLTTPGPVFNCQERISEKGKKFMLYKFRTMINDAEKSTGPVLAAKKDSRITAVGRFLRAMRMDEIPQLFNVLKGDMSIVGPRPERTHFVEQFEKEIYGYSYRHIAKAGITGLAQVLGKYSTSPEDKLRYDLLYAKGASPMYDLQIILQTIKVLLLKSKAS